MAITVPEQHVALIRKFLELPDAKIKEFVGVLQSANPQFNVADLSDEVSKRLDLPRDLTSGVIRILGSLYLTRDAGKVPLETFVDQEVGPALKRAGTFSQDTAEAQWKKLRSFLIAALSLENTLGTAAKAGYVLTQHERIFVNARILTDIRPIFHSNVSEKPGSATLVHMLRMTHRDNHRNYLDEYFALDSNDIRHLKELIDRALKKEETLKALMKNAGVTVLDPKETF